MLVLNQSQCLFYSIILPLINTIEMIVQCQWQHQSLGIGIDNFVKLNLNLV
jgi:hypothetical protein